MCQDWRAGFDKLSLNGKGDVRTMTSAGRYTTLPWRGAPERVFRTGGGPTLLLLPALFAEANRTRALTGALMRALPDHKCVAPDLPGTLESQRPLSEVSWAEWCDFADHAAEACGAERVVAIRGGALLPAGDRPRLHFSPTTGARLLRDLLRARAASDREAGVRGTMAELEAQVRSGTERLAGFDLSPALTVPLADAQPVAGAWTVRLESDAVQSDATVAGASLWRRAEPGRDDTLATSLAARVREWAA